MTTYSLWPPELLPLGPVEFELKPIDPAVVFDFPTEGLPASELPVPMLWTWGCCSNWSLAVKGLIVEVDFAEDWPSFQRSNRWLLLARSY